MTYGAAMLYQGISTLIVFQNSFPGMGKELLFKAAPSTENVLFAFVLFIPVFFVTYFTVKRFEVYLELQSERQFRNIR